MMAPTLARRASEGKHGCQTSINHRSFRNSLPWTFSAESQLNYFANSKPKRKNVPDQPLSDSQTHSHVDNQMVPTAPMVVEASKGDLPPAVTPDEQLEHSNDALVQVDMPVSSVSPACDGAQACMTDMSTEMALGVLQPKVSSGQACDSPPAYSAPTSLPETAGKPQVDSSVTEESTKTSQSGSKKRKTTDPSIQDDDGK